MATSISKPFSLASLRMSTYKPEIFAVTSGKGGVGKTSISVNLGLLMKRLKKKVLVVDADIHLGNVDLLLGLRPQYSMAEVISGERDLKDIVVKGPEGLEILPASSAVIDMLDADERILRRLDEAFSSFEHDYDMVIIDTGAGIGRNVTSFLMGADKIVVVLTPDPASIADAYGVIKVITQINAASETQVPVLLITNMVTSEEEGESLFKKMDLMVQRFLNHKLIFGGAILRDDVIRDTVRRQSPVVVEHPSSRAVNSLKLITRNLLKLPTRDNEERTSLFEGFRENRNQFLGAQHDQISQ